MYGLGDSLETPATKHLAVNSSFYYEPAAWRIMQVLLCNLFKKENTVARERLQKNLSGSLYKEKKYIVSLPGTENTVSCRVTYRHGIRKSEAFRALHMLEHMKLEVDIQYAVQKSLNY